MNKKEKKGFPYIAVMITALLTMALSFAAAHFTGFPGILFQTAGVETLGPDKAEDHDHKGETLYTCSMHPFIITREPGTCPVCAMDLVPKVVEPEVSGGVEIKIDPVTVQNMGVRTAAAKNLPLVHTIRTFGHLTYDETRMARVSPRYSGWIEKLYANFAGQLVEKGDPLFRVYAPELVTVQEEYLRIFRSAGKKGSPFNKQMLASSRSRLLNYDLTLGEIRRLEKRNRALNSIIIRSPFKGVVTEKNAVEGSYFKAGTPVYTISDLSRIWVEAHIYEYELASLKLGQEASMTLPYIPGKTYQGKVSYIYPTVQPQTRDVIIRLEFENPGLVLKPEMYADVRIKTGGEAEGLAVPSEAVLRSGEQNIVFVAAGNGKFIPRNVVLGISLDGGNLHIVSGLALGETVVTSGQFLLDSESKLREAVQKMMDAEKPPEPESEEDDFFDDMN